MHVIIEPKREPVLTHLDPLLMVRDLWRHRQLVWRLTSQDITRRYRGSYLGAVWSILTPIIMLLIYTFVFAVVFKVRWGELPSSSSTFGEFALTLFAGLIPFNVLAEVLNRAPTMILEVPNYVKRVVFPLEVLPLTAVGSAIVHSLISVAILVSACVGFLGYLSPTLVFLPLVYVPLILLTLGLAWILASLGVYVRDLGQAIGVFTQALFFLSPIFYPVSAVPDGLRGLLYANPLTGIVGGFRQTILWGAPLAWGAWGALVLMTAGLTWLGYAWFAQTKKGFADVM